MKYILLSGERKQDPGCMWECVFIAVNYVRKCLDVSEKAQDAVDMVDSTGCQTKKRRWGIKEISLAKCFTLHTALKLLKFLPLTCRVL